MQLLTNTTANGNGTAIENTQFLSSVYCYGTFNGATVTLQGSPDNTNWFDLIAFTTKGVKGLGVNARYLRGSVASAGGSTSVSLTVV